MQIINHKLEEIFTLSSKTKIQFICDGCGCLAEKPQKNIIQSIKYRKQNKLYCCANCFNKSQHETIDVFCTECGKKHKKLPNQFKKSKNHFCSQSCAAIFNNRSRVRLPEHNEKISKGLKKYYETNIHKSKGKKITQSKRAMQCILNCDTCQKTIFRTKHALNKSKHKKYFCSKSCRMKLFNKENTNIKGYNRSKAEILLHDLIKSDFPNLEISLNNRNILPSGLEIDLLIQKYNLAIELNGPVHYLPIFGDKQFIKIQNKDIQKQFEISKLGYNLIIIDISHLNSKKKTIEFLTKYYLEYIKPLLQH